MMAYGRNALLPFLFALVILTSVGCQGEEAPVAIPPPGSELDPAARQQAIDRIDKLPISEAEKTRLRGQLEKKP